MFRVRSRAMRICVFITLFTANNTTMISCLYADSFSRILCLPNNISCKDLVFDPFMQAEWHTEFLLPGL